MTSQQKWAMAADMLTSVRNLKEKTGLPSDSMVTEFQGGMETACVIPTENMADLGTALYVTEPRFHP
jgi:hypothetical protein